MNDNKCISGNQGFSWTRLSGGGKEHLSITVFRKDALRPHEGNKHNPFGSDFLDNRVRLASEPGRQAINKHIGDEQWDPDGKEAMAYERQYWKEHPRPFAAVAQVAAHIDHVAKLVGLDYVGFGSDFDGAGDSLPIGLKDVSRYPNLIAELLRLGYGETDIEKI